MVADLKNAFMSPARQQRRAQVAHAAKTLIGIKTPSVFDPVHDPLCALDIVMIAGAPWLKEALEKDFFKDESGYRKIGGGSNTPHMAYFFRSTANLLHYLKRQGFYIPKGSFFAPQIGMACFFDCEDRGRFNFSPDRSGIITEVAHGQITKVILTTGQSLSSNYHYDVKEINIISGDDMDKALIGYSDLP